MGTAGKVRITSSSTEFTKVHCTCTTTYVTTCTFVQVSFKPDLVKFKMTHLDADTVALMTRRAYDIAGCIKGVNVFLNGNKLPVSTDYTVHNCSIQC